MSHIIWSRSLVLLGVLGAMLAADQPEADAKAQREDFLRQMQARAQGMKVFRRRDDKTPIALLARPLMRYSDGPRGIADAALWAVGDAGRPAAMLKVEAYRRSESTVSWLYSAGSLDDQRIRAEWSDGHRWTAKQPGLEWLPLTNGPEPADTARGRLTQMKSVIRRIAMTATDATRGKEEQRLLTRELHRYSDPQAGIVDGVIFGFSTFGTNPSALVLIELRKAPDAPPRWHYAASRLSDAALVMSLDDKPVWSVRAAGAQAELDTWLYFWESTARARN